MLKNNSTTRTTLHVVITLLIITSSFLSGTVRAKAANFIGGSLLETTRAEGKIRPEVQQMMATAAEGGMVSVIVTLKAQANLSNVIERNRSQRLRIVILALQNQANATQGRIISLLETYQSEGTVSEFESYWVFNGLAVTATQQVINELAALPEVALITPDETFSGPAGHESMGPPEANLDLVNAPELWHLGYLGQGIVVANMDTGVSIYHPELSSRWRGGTNSWFDPHDEHPSEPFDPNGHGTQTMGVMVAGDTDGTSIGVAPGAQWIAVKIFNDQGSASVSVIHSGFQWLLDPDGDPITPDAPHVVNNSWTFQSPGCNLEFELDLQALRAASILPVFAAGNFGPGSNTGASPSNNPSAFAVGGVDDLENIYTYSSRGPSACGEAENIYPEMVAPGVDVKTTDLFSLYTSATGTSLSAPHVSGALALILDAFPNLLASEQEAALLNSGVDLGPAGPDDEFGYGRLNVFEAYQWIQGGGEPTPTPDPTVNLALNQVVSVSSAEDSSHGGDMAVDGDLGTFWKTARAKGKNKLPSEWITVDLGSSFTIGRVVLEWNTNFATEYSIRVSEDNNNWVNIFTENGGDGGNDTITFTGISARYVKMESTAWSSGSLRNWLDEFEVYISDGSEPTPTPEPSPTPTPTPDPGGDIVMHIGDLDGISSTVNRRNWSATITVWVHDESENLISGATVSGDWIGGISGSDSCITAADGKCQIASGNINTSKSDVTFSVSSVTRSSDTYNSSANHDPDGDSDGTGITVSRP